MTVDGKGVVVVWNTATGERLDAEHLDSTSRENCAPDGKSSYLVSFCSVIQLPTRIDDSTRLRRQWLTRPDPDWRVWRQRTLLAEGNQYGVAVQRKAEQTARAILAFDAFDFGKAQAHFLAAYLLEPKLPKLHELAPPPRPAN